MSHALQVVPCLCGWRTASWLMTHDEAEALAAAQPRDGLWRPLAILEHVPLRPDARRYSLRLEHRELLHPYEIRNPDDLRLIPLMLSAPAYPQ